MTLCFIAFIAVAAVVMDKFIVRRMFRPRVHDLHGRSASILIAFVNNGKKL